MSELPRQLLPDTASVGDDGWLRIGGCSIRALAAEFGTPLFVYDEQHIRNRCREAVAAFGLQRAVYASKAFLCKAMARLAYDENGQLLTGELTDYAVPKATMVPWIECSHTETPSPVNPLGVKGVGEAGTIGASPAMVNAVVDALSPLGVRHIDRVTLAMSSILRSPVRAIRSPRR